MKITLPQKISQTNYPQYKNELDTIDLDFKAAKFIWNVVTDLKNFNYTAPSPQKLFPSH